MNNDADVFMFTGGHGGSAKIQIKLLMCLRAFYLKIKINKTLSSWVV